MSVDRKAFKTAGEALDGTKNQLFLHDSLRNVPKQPVSRNQFQKIRSIVVVEES